MTHGHASAELRCEIVAEARRWIGTPYRHRASLRGSGADCLGLVRGVWRSVHVDEPEPLPLYPPDPPVAEDESLVEAAGRHLIAILPRNAMPGDVLLFRLRRDAPARHAAILAVRDGLPNLIHARSGHAVAEEAFTIAWRRRLTHAFRFPAPR